jgi:hypothetical protein
MRRLIGDITSNSLGLFQWLKGSLTPFTVYLRVVRYLTERAGEGNGSIYRDHRRL